MKFHKQTVRTVPLEDKTVLLRVDYNVPLNGKGEITDDFKIRSSLPTIQYLLQNNCKVVITSHLGRPKGRDSALSLEPIALRLAELMGQPVQFVDQTVGDKVRAVVRRAKKRDMIMLENVRFDPREEANDDDFAKEIVKSSSARYFVQDCFGVAHRAHASIEAITHHIPSVAGLLLEREFTIITQAMKSPKRPFVAVMGGAKISDKIPLVKKFIEVADTIVIGGAMANTFLAHKGYDVAMSKTEAGQGGVIDEIYEAAAKKVGADKVDSFIILPTDVAVAEVADSGAVRRSIALADVGKKDIILDLGNKSIDAATEAVEGAGTVVWNGTLGRAEFTNFSHGSARMALALATQPDTVSIVGGGDTADFVLRWDGQDGGSFTHVSTGGGASLELMSGDALPGIECLLDA